MTIVVLGAGAIGSVYGAKLSTAHDVTLVTRPAHADAINTHGLRVVGTEDAVYRVRADTAVRDLPADANARVQDGALEGSNVSAVETMVAMITAARQFEAQMKMLQTAEGDEKAAAQLLSMS